MQAVYYIARKCTLHSVLHDLTELGFKINIFQDGRVVFLFPLLAQVRIRADSRFAGQEKGDLLYPALALSEPPPSEAGHVPH